MKAVSVNVNTLPYGFFPPSDVTSVFCLTTGPQPLQERVLHSVRSSPSYFHFQCFLVSLRSSSSCLPLLRRLLTTGPQPLPERVLHKMRSNPSSFNFQCLLVSMRSSSSCLPLPPRLLGILTTICPSVAGFDHWAVQSVASRYTDLAIQAHRQLY